MPFALIAIGLILFVAAYHNNVAALGSQVSSDLTGSSGFMIWVVAIFIIGAVGYVPALKGVSRAFLVLVLLVIFLSNKGVFTTLSQVITGKSDTSQSSGIQPATPATSATPATAATPATTGATQ